MNAIEQISMSHPQHFLEDKSRVLDKVRAILPDLEKRAAETEQARSVAVDLIERLRDAGMFRMLLPRSVGGEELNLLQACRVVESIAKADGSAGWNAMVCVGWNLALSRFPKSTVDKLLEKGPDVMIRGALAPLGKLRRAGNSLMINGQWPFASGSFTPQWIAAGALTPGLGWNAYHRT